MAGRLPKGSVPAYRLHKSSGRAIVSIDGKRIYLGPFGSPESHEKYRSLISQWRAGKLREDVAALPCGADTVAVLCLRYLPHCIINALVRRHPNSHRTVSVPQG